MNHLGQVHRSPLEKAPTYIAGLDEVLEGGLPRGRTTIVMGEAGSGKTVLGLEFLFRGALAGEPGIFVGFEEPASQLRRDAATLGWDLPALEREGKLFVLEAGIPADAVLSGDFSLKGLLASVDGKGKEIGGQEGRDRRPGGGPHVPRRTEEGTGRDAPPQRLAA
ncbi:MAG: ATPase domain-containing protein [Thermodesulfobacteriota bacterium]